jgi:hypothetical protein
MRTRLDRAHRAASVALGLLALGGVGALLLWHAFPQRFPARSHDVLGAFPLAMIAIAYLVYQSAHRPSSREWLKAILLAAAFVFWAANQLWPDIPQAVLFNDIAVGLFVLDVLLVMIGWPPAAEDESFGETHTGEEETR